MFGHDDPRYLRGLVFYWRREGQRLLGLLSKGRALFDDPAIVHPDQQAIGYTLCQADITAYLRMRADNGVANARELALDIENGEHVGVYAQTKATGPEAIRLYLRRPECTRCEIDHLGVLVHCGPCAELFARAMEATEAI